MKVHQVEFVGGPLDGHTHSFHQSAGRLPRLARLAISPGVIRVLTGEQKNAKERPTSTAVYCLSRGEQPRCYFHLASIAVEKHQFGST